MSLGTLVYITLLIVVGYLIIGAGLCYAFITFTDGEIEDYLFALLIFWPITVLIVGIWQSIHFIKNTFRGEY